MDQRPYYAKISQLARFLSREEESGYMFACARDERLIRPTSEAIRNAAAGKSSQPVVLFTLDPEESLLTQLEEAGAEAQGLIVFGLDTYLRRPDQILSLNFAREGLYALGKPILFWVTQNALSLISNRATDLFTQRRGSTVFFDESAEVSEPDPFLQSRFSEEIRSQEETQRLELALDLQKKQLKEALEAGLSRRRIALDYALPLAKTYAELDGYTEALAVLEAHAPDKEGWPPDQLDELGRIFRGAHRYDEAIQFFKDAIQYVEEENPDDQSTLSIYFSELGDIFEELGQFENALSYYQKDLALSEQLARDNPHSEQLQRDWGIAIEKLADLETALGKLESAQQRYEQSLSISGQLARDNPHSEQLRRDWGIAIAKLADLETALGKLESAQQRYEQRLAISEQLARDNPHSEQLRRDLGVAYFKMGLILTDLERREEASQYFEKDLELCKQLYQMNPEAVQYAEDLAVSYENMAGLKAETDSEALEYRKKAAQLYLQLYEKTQHPRYLENAGRLSDEALG